MGGGGGGGKDGFIKAFEFFEKEGKKGYISENDLKHCMMNLG